MDFFSCIIETPEALRTITTTLLILLMELFFLLCLVRFLILFYFMRMCVTMKTFVREAIYHKCTCLLYYYFFFKYENFWIFFWVTKKHYYVLINVGYRWIQFCVYLFSRFFAVLTVLSYSYRTIGCALCEDVIHWWYFNWKT